MTLFQCLAHHQPWLRDCRARSSFVNGCVWDSSPSLTRFSQGHTILHLLQGLQLHSATHLALALLGIIKPWLVNSLIVGEAGLPVGRREGCWSGDSLASSHVISQSIHDLTTFPVQSSDWYSKYSKTSLPYKAKSDSIDLEMSCLNDTENHRLLEVALRDGQRWHMGKLRPREGKEPIWGHTANLG